MSTPREHAATIERALSDGGWESSIEGKAPAEAALAALLSLAEAGERDYLELGEELATELADERTLHNANLKKIEDQRARLDKLERKYATMKAGLLAERDRAEARAERLHEVCEVANEPRNSDEYVGIVLRAALAAVSPEETRP